MNYKLIFTLVIIFLVTIFEFYLRGVVWLLSFFVSLWTYAILLYFFHIIWKKMIKKEILDFQVYMLKFLYSVSWILLLFFLIIGWFSFTINQFFPAKMPEYTLSNGQKTVKFQAMVHIWQKQYYDTIMNNLKKFKEEGWVYFFEWVRWWTEESMDKFNKAIGIKFEDDLYKNYWKLYWVTFQNTKDFLGIVNDKDFNVDLNVDEIMSLYDKKINSSWVESKYDNAVYDVSSEVVNLLSQLNDRELKLLVYINQSILNFLMNNDSMLRSMADTFSNKDLFEVILDERNKVVSDTIIKSEYDKIYITYGLMHFKWIYELLKQSDPNWKVIDVKYLYPIKSKWQIKRG